MKTANLQRGVALISAIAIMLIAGSKIYGASSKETTPDTVASVKKVESYYGKHKNITGLGDYLKIEVSNLKDLVRQRPRDDARLMLFLDQVPMRGIAPFYMDSCGNTVVFKLTRDSASIGSWDIFYQYPVPYQRLLKVSVGYDGQCPAPSDSSITVVLRRKSMLIGCLVGLLAMIVLLVFLAVKTNIIRNDSPGAAGSYSLARTQLAFWTVLIVFAFVYIWAVTGDLPLINGSILILLSISMGTAAGASIIDYSQKDNVPSGSSQGFLIDILSDRNGVSIHRFQMFIWTIVMGFFFYRAVVRNMAMPLFDDNLLALMGISNGAYLGLKIPENKQSGAAGAAK